MTLRCTRVLVMTSWMTFVALTAAQTYTVGTCCAPFALVDADSGEPTGYAVEVMNAIGQDAGLEFEFEVWDWFGPLLPALLEGEVDIAAGPTTITDARMEMGLAFTDVYARWHDVLVVPSEVETAYASVEELAGEALVTGPEGSIYYDYLAERRDLFTAIHPDAVPGLETRVRSGEAAAWFGPSFAILYQHGLGNFGDMKIVESYQPVLESAGGIAVRREDVQLRERLDASLDRLREDGTLAELAEKWGIAPP